MQYGGTNRLHTSGGASREGERGRALPDILWRAAGVTTRPGSGLRLTVRHVEVPQLSGTLEMPPLTQQRTQSRLSRSEPCGRPLQLPTQRRSSLRDTRLLTRQQISPAKPHSVPPLSSSTAPKASRTMLPPLPAPAPCSEGPRQPEGEGEKEEDRTSTGGSSHSSSSSSLEDSEGDEIYSEGEDEGPPSRPGFESEAEKITHLFDVPFPPASPHSTAATLLQDNLQLDMERFSASVLPSGLNPRVNNIVRAFTIHGPLDRELLCRALNSVASLHPVLSASFQRANERLYLHTPPPGPISVTLESPVMGSEKPITNARRKPFHLPMRSDLVATGNDNEGGGVLSIVSLASSKNSDDSEGKPPRQRPLPSPAKKSVTFGRVTDLQSEPGALPTLTSPAHKGHAHQDQSPMATTTLVRARLIRESVHKATLILSFPRIICDFWSASLFVRQLAEAYSQLESASGASRRIEARRREVVSRFGYSMNKQRVVGREVSVGGREEGYRTSVPAELVFQQVALRERQLLRFVSKEKLWAFWEGMLTAVIRRQRGPNRVKVVPPVRIPSGLGEKIQRVPRPQTSRLRPLTGRGRPQTGRRLAGEAAGTRDALSGPKTDFHFLKFDEEVCLRVCRAISMETESQGVGQEDLLSLVCLGVYVLLLGRCCRGWGEEGREGGCEGEGERGRIRDPLQHYHPRRPQHPPPAAVVPGFPPQRVRRGRMAGRLDLGSFLVGLEISLRQSHPRQTRGLFGPLTSDVGVRVNLRSAETFLDLVLALGKTLQSVRNHHHFPISTVTDELGVSSGLPVRFCYLPRSLVLQLSDPAHFYFPETAVGVKGHGLARLGAVCYLSPLCTRLDDSRHLELCLWEGCDGAGVGGVLIHQPQVLKRELVEGLAREMARLMAAVARDPSVSLSLLSSLISPPFSSHSRSHRHH